jgi:hypothetical protein
MGTHHSSLVKMSKIMYKWSPKQEFDKLRYNAMESGWLQTQNYLVMYLTILFLLKMLIITSLVVYLILKILIQWIERV